jgi:hypothetical protein
MVVSSAIGPPSKVDQACTQSCLAVALALFCIISSARSVSAFHPSTIIFPYSAVSSLCAIPVLLKACPSSAPESTGEPVRFTFFDPEVFGSCVFQQTPVFGARPMTRPPGGKLSSEEEAPRPTNVDTSLRDVDTLPELQVRQP